jgi:EAL domain-containing protein (putative c-di-GMP-specific phosphodiesterase class I)
MAWPPGGNYTHERRHALLELSLDRVIAYFQPVLSADTKTIYSYEVLGRYIDEDGSVKSLGAFFSDPGVSEEDLRKVDHAVRRDAMRKYVEEGCSAYLFINIRLSWLTDYEGRPEELPTIVWAKEFGIPLDRIVIEITEEEFNSNDSYYNVLSYYKSVGCRIALDDYGKSASNIDRLASLMPDIIKIDMDCIHKSEASYHYREYLRTLANFGESVGIEVLDEGVETQRQLDICITSKGRYYQGFLIAAPQPSMRLANINQSAFISSTEKLFSVLQTKVSHADAIRNSLDVQVERFLAENPLVMSKVDVNLYLVELCRSLSKHVKRAYLCDRRGYQMSHNIERRDGDDISSKACGEKNWAWCGYFQEALAAFETGRKSNLSNEYRDTATKERIFTYSYSVNSDMFLFLDVLRVAINRDSEAKPFALPALA